MQQSKDSLLISALWSLALRKRVQKDTHLKCKIEVSEQHFEGAGRIASDRQVQS
jgi:hypothetical protein